MHAQFSSFSKNERSFDFFSKVLELIIIVKSFMSFKIISSINLRIFSEVLENIRSFLSLKKDLFSKLAINSL